MVDPVIALSPKLEAAIGAWGRPPDVPAKIALVVAAIALGLALARRGRSILGVGEYVVPTKVFLWLTAFAAALLSIVYVAIYLRGGPRIVDATTYFLQGRALARGGFTWPVHEPSASFRGRFLLYRETAGGGVLGGIFPPGYPMLLALGFGLGAPMVVGPALAALLVVATYRLARTFAEDAVDEPLREPVARAAALFSVACAALRYHTADTMSHGAAALGVTIALDLLLRARRANDALPALGAGLALGAVAATRPFSALGVGVVAVALLVRARRGLLARVAIGALPGLALLALAQHAVTGAWLTSSQRMYYAMSDGPPGCFRWGFGADVGCLQEHGAFVRARLPHGYGLVAALGVTARRLHLHLRDVLDLEPLALLVLAPLVRRTPAAPSRAALAGLAVVGVHVLAYAPFYFDGNYPGGGARFFADVLPIEHALAALGLARLVCSRRGAGPPPDTPLRAPRADAPLAPLATRDGRGAGPPPDGGAQAIGVARAAFAVLALALAGFGVHAVFDHEKLRDRDGGRPMFEPDELAKKNVATGLVFVNTDHAFALGHDPGARAKDGLVVARLREDDRDRLLFDRLDRPPTFLYRFDPGAPPAAPVTIVPWAPPSTPDTYRFEAEAEWPALAQAGALAAPAQGPACASNGRGLVVSPVHVEAATATISVPVPSPGRWTITPRILSRVRLPDGPPAPAPGRVPAGTLRIGDASWSWVDVDDGGCMDLPARDVTLEGDAVHATIEARFGPATLDRVVLRPKK